jgi:acyl-homoserine-lactone acylase
MALVLLASASVTPAARAAEPGMARWRAEAARVSITRDDWGIAHVHGVSDADAVFGMIYAQAEDDFPRIEANYLTALGRTAEADGEGAIWADLRQRLYADPAALQRDYAASPAWLRALMDAWADGLNYYLATHPATHPRVLTRFEPWMALSFTEGSIGGDIERINLEALKAFYTGGPAVLVSQRLIRDPKLHDPSVLSAVEGRAAKDVARGTSFDFAQDGRGVGGRTEWADRDNHLIEPRGSNGIAIAPARTRDGHALLLINPHTSFFFRAESQVTSDAGLNAYGASTWGQFFIYQGFNAHAGWMHTSSGVDSVDEFAEQMIFTRSGPPDYKYGGGTRKMTATLITLRYRKPDGSLGERTFTTFATHHGPIVREEGGKWIAFKMMWKPIEALEQSYLRTKVSDYASFLKVAALQANSSNDTLFADDKGEIAYLHPQFVPVRDDRFDYRAPVDGSDPATDWKGLTPLAQLPQAVNPASGWVYNTNDEPWNAAGESSIDKAAFPKYMDMAGANPRGEHARALLAKARGLTLPGLIGVAFDSWQPVFAHLVPKLDAAWAALPESDPRRAALAAPLALLRRWDRRWGADSPETSLAVFWGTALFESVLPAARAAHRSPWDAMYARDDATMLSTFAGAIARLKADFGKWQVPWGEINRFQRNDAAIVQRFDDAKPSTPVPFTSAIFGSLASFGAKPYPGTKRWYGTSGNSFVAVVEFGPKVKAYAVTAGGESGHPGNKHFTDQAERYAAGDLRPVYFTAADLTGHIERRYHPGESK